MKKIFLFIFLFVSINSFATTYFAVATGTWDNATNTIWSLTSGGAGGAGIPGTFDKVVFDAASGSITVTIGTGAACGSQDGAGCFTTVGFTGTITGTGTLTVRSVGNGTFIIDAGTTWTFTGDLTSLTSHGSLSPFLPTTNGKTLCTNLTHTSGVIRPVDDLIVAGTITLGASGTLSNTNNRNITCTNWINGAAGSKTFTLGSGTLIMTGTGNVWDVQGTLTVSANTGTWKITNSSASGKTFVGADKTTYNNIWYAPGAGTGTLTITGSNTFADFKDDGTTAHTILFTAGTTTTVTSFTVSGNPGQLITLNSTSSPTEFILSDASGTNNSNYLIIQDSDAAGGATWNAGANSTDVSNNTGWIFGGGASNTGAFFKLRGH